MIKTRSKHRPETYQIAMQNRPNIDRKSIENRSTIDQKSTKITIGANNVAHFVLGAVLEASWRLLGGFLEESKGPT